MGIFSNQPPVSYLATLIAGYRRITEVRTNIFYDRTWEHITHLKTAEGLVLTKEEVVEDILRSRHHYFTYEDGDVAMLIVESSGLGRPYVRSKPDCSARNNLLNLPRF